MAANDKSAVHGAMSASAICAVGIGFLATELGMRWPGIVGAVLTAFPIVLFSFCSRMRL